MIERKVLVGFAYMAVYSFYIVKGKFKSNLLVRKLNNSFKEKVLNKIYVTGVRIVSLESVELFILT